MTDRPLSSPGEPVQCGLCRVVLPAAEYLGHKCPPQNWPKAVPLPRLRLTDDELEAAVQRALDDPFPTGEDLVELTECVQEIADEWARDSLGVTEKRVKAAMEKRGWTFEKGCLP